jgi:ubiquinol-cytochrome c reductase cytochrome c subunit
VTGRRFRRAYVFVFALLAAPGVFVFLPATSRPARADPAALLRSVVAEVSAGQVEYEQHCASCHGEDAQGTHQGPPIIGLGAAFYDFMMSTGRMPLDFPTQQAIRRRPVLSEREISEITAYLVTISPAGSGVPIPVVHTALGSLSVGQQLYEGDCAPCHGSTGNGGAVGPRYAPNLHHATALQIAEAVRIGPNTMPRFDPSTISDTHLDSLARYVIYLRHPEDRGGNPLDRAGPLIEGFVAILVGLGVMVLVTRFIGSRS